MSELKNKLIKIAYENPELRGDLLPLIVGTSVEGHDKTALFEGVTNHFNNSSSKLFQRSFHHCHLCLMVT